MKQRRRLLPLFLVLALLLTSLAPAAITPAAAKGPATSIDTGNRILLTGEEVRGQIFGWGPGVSMSASLGGTFIYKGQESEVSNSASAFKFFKDSNQWYATNPATTVSFGQIFGGMNTNGSNPDMNFNHVQNKYYAFKWNGNDRGVVFQLSGAPVDINVVNRAPTTPNSSESVDVTLTTGGTPPGEQTFFLRYTTDNFASSTVLQMTGSGTSYSATIPAQAQGTMVTYYTFSSANTSSVAPGDADLMTITYNTNGGSNYSYTVVAPPVSIAVTAAKALWLDANTIAWNGVAGSSYKLLYDPDGGVQTAAENTVCTFVPTPAGPCYVNLTTSGNISGYPKNPNATGLTGLTTGLSADNAKFLLKGQVVVASYDGGGTRLDATRAQIQSVLDALYAASAKTQNLGPSYSGNVPTVRVWAPTAKSVTLRRYATPTDAEVGSATMTPDAASGVWSLTGDSSWDRQFYLFDVEVYVPSTDAVELNLVTDPYAVNLSADTTDTADPRSQFVNLADANLKPTGWDSLSKPALVAPEDIVIYETHIRDFSINDATVDTADRGTYKAFAYDGAGPHSNTTLSNGMSHLKQLQAAGLTHIHLLPTFDIASVPENSVPRSPSPDPTGYARDAQNQQSIVGAARATDGFNWGYDPYHYGAPEGSYSTNPDGITRILEFRDMVSALNQNGLRVVMDVVYNHTAASGQDDKSVLDKIVPGYYYRYTTNGALYTDSCCSDTASEYEMFEKLMIDTLTRWAVDYKVDSFRFDLMNFHTRKNMENVKAALQGLTVVANGVDGSKIYLYGEGWDFGSALAKGFTNCTDGLCYAGKYNMTGSGIGAFNDIIRDAAHGGYSEDSLQIRKQGFINGLSYDWNGYSYANRFQSDLWVTTDKLRSALRGSGTDWNGQGAPFTDDPQEAVNYVEKHDNETLYDQNVFKLPSSVSMADRVRSQNMGLSIIGLAQGIPFIQMGSDILRSKSLDRNSYDSGDWFNKVYWDKSNNNFGKGLPPTWDNNSRWGIMAPLLANTALDPATSDMNAAAAHLREILRIRKSSLLFRLSTEAEINARTSHYNTGNTQDAFIVMRLSDETGTDLDLSYENILVFFNANKIQQNITIDGANGFSLHPVHIDGIDDDPVITGGATFNDTTDTFTIPARTTAVFVSAQAITPPASASTIDWVGLMYPRGGQSNAIQTGNASGAFNVYVQVYEPTITGSGGSHTGLSCFLHWGRYGSTWADLPMTRNTGFGGASNDEWVGTLSQGTLNGLTVGTYGFTAYCQKTGETGLKWKQDTANINGNADDKDIGDGILSITPVPTPDPLPPSNPNGVFVHLFEWKWTDIQQECPYLASKGYTAVQVSPPQEHILGSEWWTRYQPVSYNLNSRSGNLAEFQAMVNACNAVGVRIYADAVVNHMTGPTSTTTTYTGWGGTDYRKYQYPYPDETLYGPAGFHAGTGACPTASGQIDDYTNRTQVQNCELLGLADLNTGSVAVQTTIRNYMNGLLGMGVAGFRIDATKHMLASDIEGFLAGLNNTNWGARPYIFTEVIEAANEPVKEYEYFYDGDVTEFEVPNTLAWTFSGVGSCNGKLSDLASFTTGTSYMASSFAQVFVDNHDNQRGQGTSNPCIVTYKDGVIHNLANVFLLAWPYGYPSVMSSYYFSTNDQGPPSTLIYSGGSPTGCNGTDWVCEHRHTAIANMVQFRNATGGEPVTNWWTNGNDQIAFGRNGKGYVAINRESSSLTRTFQTGMAKGIYCDIIKYDFLAATNQCVLPGTTTDAPVADLILVDNSGQIADKTLAAMDAFAIHRNAKLTTDFGSAAASYGEAWHTQNVANLRLGTTWGNDDGVTRNAWIANEGSVNLTVNGADGYVTAWLDWNQDGDFTDDGERAFANEAVTAGQTKVKTFTHGTWDYAQPLNARFRVYSSEQTVQALAAPDAAPQPAGGATGGEVEDHAWTFSPLAVTLVDFSAVQQGDAILVTWETASELDNRGFNLWRGTSPAGPDRQLNATLIPSQSQGNPGGFIYTWEDRADLVPGSPYFYWIDAVDIYGLTTRHGPVSTTFSVPTAVTLTGIDTNSSSTAPLSWGWIALALLAALAGVRLVPARLR